MAGFNRPNQRPAHPLVDAARTSGVRVRRERGQFTAYRFGRSVELVEDRNQMWWVIVDSRDRIGPYPDLQDLLRAASDVLTEQADRSRHQLVQEGGAS